MRTVREPFGLHVVCMCVPALRINTINAFILSSDTTDTNFSAILDSRIISDFNFFIGGFNGCGEKSRVNEHNFQKLKWFLQTKFIIRFYRVFRFLFFNYLEGSFKTGE